MNVIAKRRLRNAMKAKPLDFLVIGAHKAATTALFHYLRHHPRLFLPPEKEAGFFSNDYWWERGWDAFADEFFGQAPATALWGKVTPQYMAYPQVPARIRAAMPEVKLVAILRNPVDRAYSHYRMAVRTQAEKRSFEVAMEASRQNPGDSSGYVALGQYGRILSTYLKHFPHTQLLTLFTEDLEKQPHSSLDAIVRYLGLEARFTRQFREAISRRRNAPAVFLARPYGKASLSSLVDVETIAGTAPKSHSFLVSNRGRHSLCTFRSNGLESASPTGGVLPK